MITTGIIKNLKPCTSRFENYLNHYKNVNFTYAQFIGLDKISFEDKMWVLTRLMSLENAVLFAQDAAQDAAQYAAKSANQDAAQDAARFAAQYAQDAAQDAAKSAALRADQDATQYVQYAVQYTSQVLSRYFVLGLILKYL